MEGILFLLSLTSLLVVIIAQIRISSAYSKYKKVPLKRDIAGWEVARKILDSNGMQNIYVVETKGNLTDHYDPTKKVVRLSTDIYHGKTVAAASVAAHECGHAIQDKEDYKYMRIRNSIIPIVNLSSKLGYISILIGFLFGMFKLALLGVVFEIVILGFHLITIPIEFDASKRGKQLLEKLAIVDSTEKKGCSRMLKAAAGTYVASLISAILEILRLLLIIAGNDRD